MAPKTDRGAAPKVLGALLPGQFATLPVKLEALLPRLAPPTDVVRGVA